MSSQGVPDSVFMRKLSKATKKLSKKYIFGKMYRRVSELADQEKITLENSKKLMEEALKYFGSTRRFQDVFRSALIFSVYHRKKLQSKSDQDLFKELIKEQPLFDQVLTYMVLDQTLALKKKARILVPNCAVLMGVIDQYGYLKEGEIFVQILPGNFRTMTFNPQKEEDKLNASNGEHVFRFLE